MRRFTRIGWRVWIALGLVALVGAALAIPALRRQAQVYDGVVQAVGPEDGAQNVALNTPITVSFAGPVIPDATLQAASDDPRLGAGLPKPLTVWAGSTSGPPIEGAGRWITPSLYSFYPEEGLHAATTYHVTLHDTTSDGQLHLRGTRAWQFTTISRLIASARPYNGAIDVALDSPIELFFDSEIDLSNAGDHFRLVAAGGDSPIPGRIAPIPGGFEFRPANPLESSTSYEIELLSDPQHPLRSRYGQALAYKTQTWRFSTVRDLEIARVSPLGGERNVDPSQQITVHFNRDAVALGGRTAQDGLPQPLEITPPVPGVGRWRTPDTYVYTATVALNPATTYKLHIADGLTSPDGGVLRKSYDWQFQTRSFTICSIGVVTAMSNLGSSGPSSRDENCPTNLPPNDEIGPTILLPNAVFRIEFSLPVDADSLPNAVTLLRTDTAEPVPTTLQVDGAHAVITPTIALRRAMTYRLAIDGSVRSAAGHARLDSGGAKNFVTLPPPVLLTERSTPRSRDSSVAPGSLLTGGSGVRLNFNVPMDVQSVLDQLQIEPQPKAGITRMAQESPTEVRFDFEMLPRQSYSITVGGAAHDIYGVPLVRNYTIVFTTTSALPAARLVVPLSTNRANDQRDRDAAFSFAESHIIGTYSAYDPARIMIRHVNIPDVDYSIYRLSREQVIRLIAGQNQTDWLRFRPEPASLLKQEHLTLDNPQDQQWLSLLNAGKLAPGLYHLVINSASVTPDYQLMAVSRFALTIKRADDRLLVWAVDLASGRPVPDLALNLSYLDRRAVTTSALGRTNGDGLLETPLAPLSINGDVSSPLFVWSPEGDDFAFASTTWNRDISAASFTSLVGRASNAVVGNVYTDRPLYRPGQLVNLRGTVRIDHDGFYALPPADRRVRLTINDPRGNLLISTQQQLNETGSFSTSLQLESVAPVGEYGIFVSLDGERLPNNDESPLATFGRMTIPRHHFYGSFTVADYRKPTFNVRISPETISAIPGSTVELTVTTSYFSGEAVANAPLTWYTLAAPFDFKSASDPLFLFGHSESAASYFGPQNPSRESGTTGTRGQFHIRLPIGARNASSNIALHVEALDLAGQTVNHGQAIITVATGKFNIGLHPQRFVARAGEAQSIDLLVVDPADRPVRDQPLDVTVYEQRVSESLEQGSDGRSYHASNVEEVPIDQSTIVTGPDGKASIPFRPPEGGAYRVVASGRDDRGNDISSSVKIYAAGAQAFWGIGDTNQITLVADHETYRPGDTARILVPAPYAGMTGLLTLERGRVIEHRTFTITGTTGLLEIPIRPEYTPNIYVSVVLIKAAGATNDTPDLRVGTIALNVPIEQQLLKIEITPDTHKTTPKSTLTFHFHVTDSTGKGVRADLSCALVDEKLLAVVDQQLRRDPTPTYTQNFFGRRRLGVETSNTLVQLVDRVTLRVKPGSKGGAGGPASVNPQVGLDLLLRREFPDVAAWQPSLITDDTGNASLTVNLPDNLTTWTMVARAITADTRFGQATERITTDRPLYIDPHLPGTLMAGDHAVIRARVQNTTEHDILATVQLAATGLQIEQTGRQQVSVPAKGNISVTWDVAATADGQATLHFRVDGEGVPADRLDQTFTVWSYSSQDDHAIAGQVEDTSANSIVLPPQPAGVVRRELQLAVVPSLSAATRSALLALEQQPSTNVEQTVSGFLPHVVATRLGLEVMPEQQRPSFDANIAVRLQRLYRQQNLDGGWGWWGEEYSSQPYLTAYVVQGLIEARKAGYTIDEQVLTRALDYLERALASADLDIDSDEHWRANAHSYVLYVLTVAGRSNASSTMALYDARGRLAIYGRAYLLLTLDALGGEADRIHFLADELTRLAIPRSAGVFWSEPEIDLPTMSSDTHTTALVAQSLIRADPSNAVIPGALSYLVGQWSTDGWRSSHETAQAVQTLAEYLARTGAERAGYRFSASLDGQKLLDQQVNGATLLQPAAATIDLGTTGTTATLAIERADGLLPLGRRHLFYNARIRSYPDMRSLQPLDHGIAVERTYLTLDPSTLRPNNAPINQVAQNEIVLVQLKVTIPDQAQYLVVEDRLPGGLEPLTVLPDSSRGLTRPPPPDPSLPAPARSYFTSAEFYGDRVALFATEIQRGTYYYAYLARATIAGNFQAAPASAYQMYQPNVYGRSAGAEFTVIDTGTRAAYRSQQPF